MADLTSTQLKLRSTPTAGVSSEQSPYYRRLLSAGYKGFLQGTVGGATLYGVMGAAIGGAVALFAAPVMGAVAFGLVPAMAGIGLYKGASTFGNIGSFAAITAESAEMSEKRRYLLDRYYDLPDTPEYDAEAQQIQTLLARQHESKRPTHMFHWRPALTGALIGIGVALLFAATPAMGMAYSVLTPLLSAAQIPFTLGSFSAGAVAVSAGIGALTGAMVGLDRFHVRNWLDKSANVMHDSKSIEDQVREHEREIENLGQCSPERNPYYNQQASQNPANARVQLAQPGRDVEESHPAGGRRAEPITPRQIAGLSETPNPNASQIEHHDRIAGKILAQSL